MGTSLNGLTPQDTYPALIKVGDNTALSATAKVISDGLGNDSILALSTTAVGIGTNAPTATTHIKGSGSTSATTALLVQNSAGTQTFKVEDGGVVTMGRTDFIFWTISSNTFSSSQYAIITGNNGVVLSNGGINGGVYADNNGSKVADSGIATPQVASAVLEVASTTKGFLPPRMTTTQKNAIATPAAGLVVYDSTTNKLCCYNGTTWNDLF